MSDPFLERLTLFGISDAIVFDGQAFSYRQLLKAVEDWQSLLSSSDVTAGDVVVLDGPLSIATCAGLLALIDRGATIVPLASTPPAKREEFLELAQAEVVITVDDSGQRNVAWTGRQADHELYQRLRAAGRPGLVLFSSGTTGRSKASVLDFGKVLSRYGEPTRPQRILSFLSLDHIGGINTLLHTLSQGGSIITVRERTPEAVFTAIGRDKVQVLPTTPTFLNMVLIAGVLERHATQSRSLVTYGTPPMPLQTLQRLKEALPHVRLKQTYGLSELGILPTRSKDDNSLWLKIGGSGFDYKIVDNVLWVRSEMAMLGYLNAPAPFDKDGYFNTQDVVETDGDYIKILGRKSEILNVAGEKVYPAEVENVLLEIPNITEATVSGHPSPVTGTVVKATVQTAEDEDEASLRRRIRAFCQERMEAYKVPALITVSAAPQHSERFKKIRSAR